MATGPWLPVNGCQCLVDGRFGVESLAASACAYEHKVCSAPDGRTKQVRSGEATHEATAQYGHVGGERRASAKSASRVVVEMAPANGTARHRSGRWADENPRGQHDEVMRPRQSRRRPATVWPGTVYRATCLAVAAKSRGTREQSIYRGCISGTLRRCKPQTPRPVAMRCLSSPRQLPRGRPPVLAGRGAVLLAKRRAVLRRGGRGGPGFVSGGTSSQG